MVLYFFCHPTSYSFLQPFSTANTSVSYHGGSPTVLRYTTSGSMSGAGVRQVSNPNAATVTPTGILRRVGSSMVGGSAQSVFAVTPASASGATHVISVGVVLFSLNNLCFRIIEVLALLTSWWLSSLRGLGLFSVIFKFYSLSILKSHVHLPLSSTIDITSRYSFFPLQIVNQLRVFGHISTRGFVIVQYFSNYSH